MHGLRHMCACVQEPLDIDRFAQSYGEGCDFGTQFNNHGSGFLTMMISGSLMMQAGEFTLFETKDTCLRYRNSDMGTGLKPVMSRGTARSSGSTVVINFSC
jgi:hypothetical protein